MQWVHRRFATPLLLFATFCKKPCSVSLWPKKSLRTYMWPAGAWICVADRKYADSAFKSKLSHNLRWSFCEPWSLTPARHRNDLNGLIALAAHPNVDGSVECMSMARHVEQMCVQSVSLPKRETRQFICLTVNKHSPPVPTPIAVL